MPYNLSLPAAWSSQRWKAKIFDREGAEEPHFSIIRGSTVWRVGLRTFTFLDRRPPAGDVPGDLLDEIRSHLEELRAACACTRTTPCSRRVLTMAETLLYLAPRGTKTGLSPALPGQSLRTADEVRSALAKHGRSGAVWVGSPESTVRLLSWLSGPPKGNHRLLVVGRTGFEHRSWLHALFRIVVAEGHGTKLLAPEDLADVLRADNRTDLFVGGAVDLQAKVLVLFRGNLQPLVVPLAWFKPTGDGTRADPTDFEVIDGGTSIRMGAYEASARSILYDLDPVFRRKAKRQLIEQDGTLGGALRRLRLLRGLPRSAFEPEVTEKEVTRIELGRVKKPRASTVKALAAKLQVEPGELASY